jgi:ribonuclease P protein component
MYKTVYEGGRVIRSTPLTLRYFQADQDFSRVGFIIRKKTGKACLRNSIRRTLRRSFQEALPSLREGIWLVFDVSDKAAALRRRDLRAEADTLLRHMPQADQKA